MNYEVLRAELLTDPLVFGYSGMSDAVAAAKLIATNTGRTLPRTNVSMSEVIATVPDADYPASSNSVGWQKLNLFATLPGIDASNANIRAVFNAIFAGKTATLAALAALASRVVSRAEELGLGVVMTGDVNRARSGAW